MSQAQTCSHCSRELLTLLTCSKCQATHYCNRECQLADWGGHKHECKKIAPSAALKKLVQIEQSRLPGAGLGIFAQENIRKDSPVTGYYGNTLRWTFESMFPLHGHRHLQPIVNGLYLIIGEPHAPAPHLAGQLANDPYVSSDDLKLLLEVPCAELTENYINDLQAFSRKYIHQWVEDQKRLSGTSPDPSLVNIEIETLLSPTHYPRMVARRDIEPGEELYYDYGIGYWLGQSLSICKKRGLPQSAIRIERAFSEALEELIFEDPNHTFYYLQFRDESPNYITHEKWRTELHNYNSSSISILTELLGEAEVHFIPSTKRLHEGILRRFTPFQTLLNELKDAPFSEFMDEAYFSKPHPQSLIFLQSFIDHLKTYDLDTVPIAIDYKTQKEYTWEEILEILRSN